MKKVATNSKGPGKGQTAADVLREAGNPLGVSLNATPENGGIPAAVREILEGVARSINAAVTTQDAKEILGEPWLSELKSIHGQINASIGAMADTEKVPAAQEGFYALGALKSQMLYIQNFIQNLVGGMKDRNATYTTAMAGVPKQISDAIAKKLTDGELYDKTALDLAVKTAADAARADGLKTGDLKNVRVMALASAKIPSELIPGIAPAVLLGEEKDFNAARDLAATRIGLLTAIGFTVNTMGGLPWADQAAFDTDYNRFKAVHDSARGVVHATAPAKPAPTILGASALAGGGGPAAAAAAPAAEAPKKAPATRMAC